MISSTTTLYPQMMLMKEKEFYEMIFALEGQYDTWMAYPGACGICMLGVF